MVATSAVMIGLAAASAAAGVATTVVSASNAAAQQKQAAATADYNAQVEQRNAFAERTQQQAQDEQTMAENNQRLGAIRALYGASGVDATGTPLDVLQGNANQMAYQTKMGDYTEQLRQMGYQSEAQGLEAQADADRQQARNATGLSMGLGIGSSLIGGAASYYGMSSGKAGLFGAAGGEDDPFAGGGVSPKASLQRAG